MLRAVDAPPSSKATGDQRIDVVSIHGIDMAQAGNARERAVRGYEGKGVATKRDGGKDRIERPQARLRREQAKSSLQVVGIGRDQRRQQGRVDAAQSHRILS